MQTDEILNEAFGSGRIIRCTESNGRVVEFANPVDDVWVRMYASEEEGHVCTEAAVRNCVMLCNPDVELVEEGVSLFAAKREETEANWA